MPRARSAKIRKREANTRLIHSTVGAAVFALLIPGRLSSSSGLFRGTILSRSYRTPKYSAFFFGQYLVLSTGTHNSTLVTVAVLLEHAHLIQDLRKQYSLARLRVQTGLKSYFV